MFYYTYLNLNYFTSASMLMYTRNFLFSLQNCWELTSKNLGHGLMHRPLSRQVWLTLKNINLLVPMRGQRERNHLRRPNDKSINVITRAERQQNVPEKRRSTNQRNLLNIPVDTFAAKTSDRNNKGMNRLQKSKIKMAHLNIRSLKNRNHLIQLRNIAEEENYGIIAISESWLNSTVSNAEVEIVGYKLSRLDRLNKTGGGVCVYTRRSLKTKVLRDLTGISNSGFHQLWLQIQHDKLKSFLLCVTYRPPDCPTSCFVDNFHG